jgi:hypothetical protein
MANPSGFEELALPPGGVEELDPDPVEDCADPFLDPPKAAVPNVKTAQRATTGIRIGTELRIGAKNLST